MADQGAARSFEVGTADQLLPGQRKLAFVDGQSIVLFNIEGSLHAIENSCPHNGASLAPGRLDGRVLSCPAHGLRFDLVTGRMPGGVGPCLKKHAVHCRDGKLVVVVEP